VAGILHICMANRARSALAELSTRDLLGRRGLDGAIAVGSAGTRSPGGLPIWPAARQEADRHGWSTRDVEAFRSRALTVDLVREADLVLAATRALRDEVITLAPFALRRTFTWRELAWLLDGVAPDDVAAQDPASRLRAVPDLARRRRGHLRAPLPEQLDVDDPVQREPAYLPVATDLITQSVGVLVGLLDRV
jgi:protein-tyrosine phosphatase